jgi:hypothetical protein
MTSDEIQFGHYYWVRVADLPERRVLVDWSCPADDPAWFCCWDVATGDARVHGAGDFLCRCDDEVTWSELLRLGPEHRHAAGEAESRSDLAPCQASVYHG